MSKNMVERVARALLQELKRDTWQHVEKNDRGETVIDGEFDLSALARAAIEAMAPATEEMIKAGYTTIYDNDDAFGAEHPRDAEGNEIHWEAWTTPRVWNAMITAALKP